MLRARPGPTREDRQARPRARVSSRLLVVAVAGVLLLGGCTAAKSRSAAKHPGSTAPPTTAMTTTTTQPPLPVSPVQWSGCGAGLECGSVTVPLDYSHPQGTTIQIAVERHPAEIPSQRIGSLVINPGGPGGSGINDLPNELGVLTSGLLDDFDIVSFDPRGVQRSDPVNCGANGAPADTTSPLPDPAPSTPAAQQALLSNAQAYAAQCNLDSSSLLPFVGTERLNPLIYCKSVSLFCIRVASQIYQLVCVVSLAPESISCSSTVLLSGTQACEQTSRNCHANKKQANLPNDSSVHIFTPFCVGLSFEIVHPMAGAKS